MFTPEQLAAATSPESAAVIADYPYGFTLRCQMRVWIEYKPGHGFRYCTQTTNPKKPFTLWNAPKRGTYARVSMAIRQDDKGHLYPASVSEYADAAELEQFTRDNAATLSPRAAESLAYFLAVKTAYRDASAAQGVSNIYDATPDQRAAIGAATRAVIAAHVKAGTAY